MDFEVPLNRLIFGQEDGAGINARVTGRQDGIAELAANLHARGQIENLVVKRVADRDGFYSVSNGNRRLAAFHMIYTADSSQPIRCTLRDVDEDGAFEDSLTTAVLAKQLHPVDQFEAFARLEEHGKTHEEIARQYGMTEKEVRQALALGRLSPIIREAWRSGEIKAEVARAFTLALDPKTQDRAFEKLKKEGRLYEHLVKAELGAGASNAEVAQLIDVVGADAYRGRGGEVTEDLFGSSHVISDVPLLKQMAIELLETTCSKLLADGWSWAALEGNLPQGARFWSKSELKDEELVFEGDEEERLEKAILALKAFRDDENNSDYEQDEALERAVDDIETAIRSRSFPAKKKSKLGCIVDIEDGRLVVLYGIKKPTEVKISGGGSARDEDDAPAPGKKPAASSAPEEPEISNALLHRLSIQLTNAAATALIQDEQLALSVLLAGIGCYSDCGVKASVNGLGAREGRGMLGSQEMAKALSLATQLKPAERISLMAQIAANALDFQNASLDVPSRDDKGPAAICNAIDPKALNAALRGAFDAKDYFAGVSKALNLKAIEEACGPDLARQQSKNGKPDIVAFAIENVPKTGWLPVQLRAKGYDGPPKAKVLAVVPKGNAGKPKRSSKKPAAKAAPVKRAAAAKKAAKKTTAKTKKR
ncbi:MAG: ParB/RepB/Spo0J family partition protein [Rhodocyclaceae bacterium]